MNWQTLVTPVIVAAVPILVIGFKRIIPDRLSFLYPIIATALGPVLDFLSTYATGHPADPAKGALMGMAGVALREVIDQIQKIPTGPRV